MTNFLAPVPKNSKLFKLKIDTLLTTHIGIRCSTCVLANFCLPAGMSVDEMTKIDALIENRRYLKKGDYLYRQSENFSAIYSVRFGALKTINTLRNGCSQVIGFHLSGEMLGLDGIGDEHYHADAIALEESEVCEIPFDQLESLSRQIPTLQKQFHRIFSYELTRDRQHLFNLGSLHAIEKLAGFLINLSLRYTARGYQSDRFYLQMSREEIGSYLGVKIETVSREFTRFVNAGLIKIDRRHIKLIDVDGLYEIAAQAKPSYLCLDKAA